MCELKEELNSHKKVEKSINTVISTKMVQDATKEECKDDKSSEEMNNRLGSHSTKERTEQWTAPKDHNYPSDYDKKLLNCLEGVRTHEVSFLEGECTEQWTIPKECTCPSNYGEKLLNRLEGVRTSEVSFLEKERTVQWTVPKECTYSSDYGKNSLNRLGGVEGEGGYLQWTGIADNEEVQSENSEKSLIRCNIMERNLHSVNMEVYIKRKDQLDKRENKRKIN